MKVAVLPTDLTLADAMRKGTRLKSRICVAFIDTGADRTRITTEILRDLHISPHGDTESTDTLIGMDHDVVLHDVGLVILGLYSHLYIPMLRIGAMPASLGTINPLVAYGAEGHSREQIDVLIGLDVIGRGSMLYQPNHRVIMKLDPAPNRPRDLRR